MQPPRSICGQYCRWAIHYGTSRPFIVTLSLGQIVQVKIKSIYLYYYMYYFFGRLSQRLVRAHIFSACYCISTDNIGSFAENSTFLANVLRLQDGSCCRRKASGSAWNVEFCSYRYRLWKLTILFVCLLYQRFLTLCWFENLLII